MRSTISGSSICIKLSVFSVLGVNGGRLAFELSTVDIDTKKSFKQFAFSKSVNAYTSSPVSDVVFNGGIFQHSCLI